MTRTIGPCLTGCVEYGTPGTQETIRIDPPTGDTRRWYCTVCGWEHGWWNNPDGNPGEWKTWDGFSKYEVSNQGLIRRRSDGFLMALFPDKDRYLRVTLTGDDGKKYNLSVARCVLTAHDRPCPPGMESRHWNDDPQDNRWAPGGENACVLGLGNLVWGTKEENLADRARNRPPRARPGPAPCVNHERCGGYAGSGGRRCHACVVQLGKDGAELLWSGMRLADAAEQLGYPAIHLHTLAVKYGGYGQRPSRWSQRVISILRGSGDAP